MSCLPFTATLSVSENATDPPQEDEKSINDPNKLSDEARFINNNFTQQVLQAVS